MSRRTIAGLLALGLLVVLGGAAWRTPVDYVTFRPGPTMNVLGKFAGKTIITVTGHQAYRDTGALRMVTVYPSGPDENISLLNMVYGWVDPDIAVLPKDVVYKPNETSDSAHQESAVEMTSSQDNATAAALHTLGVRYRSAVRVSDVTKGGPADGKLRAGDLILAVDGTKVTSLEQGVKLIQQVTPRHVVRLRIDRDNVERQVAITTAPSDDDPKKSVVKVAVAASFDFPFRVKLGVSDNIGGPSAGMIFALAVYDLLTPGSLTGGKVIAGTGEISADGTVGPIGGIQQKLVGAQHDGARLFLVPAANCAEALGGHYDSDKMRLVRISTLGDAVSAVEKWSKDPHADLPRCTAS